MTEKKNIRLWQAYQWWYELSEMRKKHTLRLDAIKRGTTQMDKSFEDEMLEKTFTFTFETSKGKKKIDVLKFAKGRMIEFASEVPCFEWATSIRGLKAGAQVAKVLAMIDDISKFDTVSKLWRYAGYGVYEYWFDADGKLKAPKNGYKSFKAKGTEFVDNTNTVCPEDKPDARKAEKDEIIREFMVVKPKDGWELRWIADRGVEGFNLSFNKPLKSSIYVVVDMFIKHNPPVYRDYYDEQKERYRELYPEKIKVNGKTKYNDGHINNMTIRKVAKLWLQHLWLVWRTLEDLPVTKPYIHTVGGHTHYIKPPNFDMNLVHHIED